MQSSPSSSSCFKSGNSVYSEIIWGTKFRRTAKAARQKKTEKKCGDKKNKCKIPNPCATIDALFAALNAEGKKQYADPFKVIRKQELLDRLTRKRKKKPSKGKKKTKIVNRDLLTRRQHIDLLAKPRVIPPDTSTRCENQQKKEIKKKKKKKKCCKKMVSTGTELSPRLKQLALPTKRLVYANWAQYQHVLDADTVVRMESILVAGKGENLDAEETKRYFKTKDKKKCKKRKASKNGEDMQKKYLQNEINILADLIVCSFTTKPLVADNNRHIQLTNSLIATLRFKGFRIKDISRNTKSLRKRTVLGILDHISVWSDQVFQEAEVLDREISIRRYEKMLQRYKEQEEAENRQAAAKAAAAREAAAKDRRRSSATVSSKFSQELTNQEVIETLIQILTPIAEYKEELFIVIHFDLLPGVTYKNLLDKLLDLRTSGEELDLEGDVVQPIKDEVYLWTKKFRQQYLTNYPETVIRAIDALSRCLLKMFEGAVSSEDEGSDEGSEEGGQEQEDFLMSLGEDVDLSEIPTYKDPNEDLQDEPETEPVTDDENAFDRSMYVGSSPDMFEEEDDEVGQG